MCDYHTCVCACLLFTAIRAHISALLCTYVHFVHLCAFDCPDVPQTIALQTIGVL